MIHTSHDPKPPPRSGKFGALRHVSCGASDSPHEEIMMMQYAFSEMTRQKKKIPIAISDQSRIPNEKAAWQIRKTKSANLPEKIVSSTPRGAEALRRPTSVQRKPSGLFWKLGFFLGTQQSARVPGGATIRSIFHASNDTHEP